MSNEHQKPAAIVTENAISIFYNGKLYPPITKDHKNFNEIKECIRNASWEKIDSLINGTAIQLKKYISNQSDITLDDGIIKYKGDQLNTLLTTRIIELMKGGFEVKPLLNFLENLMQNPSKTAISELYKFLEHKSLPITEDGHFLAYKAVKNNYMDIHSGTFDNSIGKKPEVPRNSVDTDCKSHCSTGLHVGAISYVKSYGHFSNGPISPNGNRLMIVKVNPIDAVCVPDDHSCTKLRVCKYEVVGEITDLQNILNGVVYTSNNVKIEPTVDSNSDSDDDDDLDDDREDYSDSDDSDDDCETESELSIIRVKSLTDTDQDYFIGRNEGVEDKKSNKGYSPRFSDSKRYMRGYKNGYEKTK